jgi:hypothetical protein
MEFVQFLDFALCKLSDGQGPLCGSLALPAELQAQINATGSLTATRQQKRLYHGRNGIATVIFSKFQICAAVK